PRHFADQTKSIITSPFSIFTGYTATFALALCAASPVFGSHAQPCQGQIILSPHGNSLAVSAAGSSDWVVSLVKFGMIDLMSHSQDAGYNYWVTAIIVPTTVIATDSRTTHDQTMAGIFRVPLPKKPRTIPVVPNKTPATTATMKSVAANVPSPR